MFKKILVLVDEQPACMQAIRLGVEIARVNGGQIVFFHLLPNFDILPVGMHEAVMPRSPEYEQDVRSVASAVLNEASSMAEAAGVLSFGFMGSGGARSEAQCVADIAERRHCELIVVATDSRNALVRLIGGSIVPGLISSAKMPVLVCQFEDQSGKRSRRASGARAARPAAASPAIEQQQTAGDR